MRAPYSVSHDPTRTARESLLWWGVLPQQHQGERGTADASQSSTSCGTAGLATALEPGRRRGWVARVGHW